MSYSTLFTSGLSLASQPRPEHRPPPLQINIHPGTPRPRLRKRRSSLTIATSPISAIKSPTRTANESLRAALLSPREGSFLESLQASARPKAVRRKTVSNVRDLPSYPAPTSPLPTLPPSSYPASPTEDACPSSPIRSESSFPAWLRPSNHSRKSSSTLAPPSRTRSSSTASGRGPLSPSPLAGNVGHDRDHDYDNMMVEKDVPAAEWFDDDEEMKENGSEA